MMKKLYLIVITALLLTSGVMADHRSKGGHMDKRMDRLATELQLTDEQKQSVTAIVTEQWKKGREIKRAAFEKVKPEMEALHDETRQRLADILNEEQLQKFDELSDKRHERMKKRSWKAR